MKNMNLIKMPTMAKNISRVIKEKLSKRDVKEGVDLLEFARNLARKNVEKLKKEEMGEVE